MHKSAGVPRGRLSSDCCLLTAKIRQAAISKSMQNIAKPKCLGARGSINLVMVPIVSLTPRIMTHCTVSYKYTGPIACLTLPFAKTRKQRTAKGAFSPITRCLLTLRARLRNYSDQSLSRAPRAATRGA